VHLAGFIIKIYYDAQSSERQKEWIIGCNGNNEVRSSERVICDATREWKQPHMNCLIVINSVWLHSLTVTKEW